MLAMRPDCERCGRDLPADQLGAMICSFECTFCGPCADTMDRICPNCGGGFGERPTRVGEMLARNPADTQRRYTP
ncbi:DUF1272 domain-containing protein [Sphingomonas sp. MMS24-J13]|uniref:DUF1272 domain-containing protein n=1 Tax=Sphingomonas sp. MMS24-J13 TaxID=3238686 RepID=UPI00384FDD63